MAGNSFGQAFKITTAGESHGKGNVVIIDGCPPGIQFSEEDIQPDLDRRKPGQSSVTTQRKESDTATILSGVFEGKTTGTSIAIFVPNEDQRSRDYSNIFDKYRPGHADYTFDKKYGLRDYRGGGRSSARETISRVAAGTLAKKIIAEHGINTLAYVKQVGHVAAQIADPAKITLEQVEANIVRCPDPEAAEKMITLIKEVRKDQDSIGGLSEMVITGVPAGLGEPVFDKLKAELAKAIMSIPAVTAFEYGAGFSVVEMRGSQNNDLFEPTEDGVHTCTNNHGGMLGGISSGETIIMRAAVKPTSSLPRTQKSVNQKGEAVDISTGGRHDPCLLPRFVPIAESMCAIVIADHLLRWRAQCPSQTGSIGDAP
ncbi:chorismate synthase [Lentisphaera marina]|uniref:chorismate synthase n=1 Tax=Lentisphaera marina TaxID=1111041 RepID=UPI002366AF4D|nr:chorismate synthase [Lentisphaera marina]MDD7984563.1 chorismate synthase [Lentisphaera marina]